MSSSPDLLLVARQAMLSLASRGASKMLDLRPEDTLLYSAKMIPGNEKRVIRMMNQVGAKGFAQLHFWKGKIS
jgi:mRNA degradation ribonuclease J1/J2